MRKTVHVVALAALALACPAWGQDDIPTREVIIAQGTVRGYKSTDFDVFEFYNIPYASAPEGADKFKAPLAAPVWNGTFDAVNRGITCPQVVQDLSPGPYTEDCLVANIFTPSTGVGQESQNKVPVLVIVHGGAYQVGAGWWMRARGFVENHNVIAVTFNYRVAVHGFLCLGTENAPGNAGMKDQVALLRWVRDNIAQFGGNPDDVTITGCSAGGSSVDTLLLSKLTDGLFNKVIVDSGCSIAPFGTQLDPLQNAKDHVFRLNYTINDVDVEDITALADFYTTTPLERLHDYDGATLTKTSYFVFQPCVEKYVGQEMFLDDAPMNILRSGNYKKMPILYGYASREGMMALPLFDEWKITMNERFSDFLPADLEFENEEQKEEVAKEVKEFYFGNNTVNEDSVLSYIDYFTDVTFVSSILRTVTLQVEANNTQVYLYDFSFVHNGSQTILDTGVKGADHCDQIHAILDVSISDPTFFEMSRTMRQMISDFIKTGNPTPQGNDSIVTWLPSGVNRSPHLSVGSVFEMLGVPLESRAALWDSIYEKHYRMPIAPNPNAATLHVFLKQSWIMYAIGFLIYVYK